MANSYRVKIPWLSTCILAFFILIQHSASGKIPGLFMESKISAGQRSFFYIWTSPVRRFNCSDGIVTGSGTKDDPYLIEANYYYYGLSEDEISGLMQAIRAYNNGDTAFAFRTRDSTIYVRFELRAEEVLNADIAKAKAVAAVRTVNYTSYHFGTTITDGPGIGGELGSGNNKSLILDGRAVDDLLRKKPGGTAAGIFTGIVVHEIGHNLGGVHGDPGHIMTDQQTENVGTGMYKRTGSSVDTAGIRAIAGRINEGYGNIISRYLTDPEINRIRELNRAKRSWEPSNGRIRHLP